MASNFLAAATLLGVALHFAPPPQQNTPLSEKVQKELAKSRAHYDGTNDPVGRAKALTNLGRAEIRAAREMADAGNYTAALQYVKDYGDQARAAHDALVKTEVNAESHSAGFRQLQISVRESIRAIPEIAGEVPFAQRQPFDAQLQDLENLNQQLILELFPRQPGHKAEKEKHSFG